MRSPRPDPPDGDECNVSYLRPVTRVSDKVSVGCWTCHKAASEVWQCEETGDLGPFCSSDHAADYYGFSLR